MTHQLRFNPRGNDDGVTLLEVIATLVVLSLILPAIYTAYSTVVRSSELSLARLSCISAARHEIENLKAIGYTALLADLNAGTNPDHAAITTGVEVTTAMQKVQVESPENHILADALHITVTAKKGSVSLPFDFYVVEGGY